MEMKPIPRCNGCDMAVDVDVARYRGGAVEVAMVRGTKKP